MSFVIVWDKTNRVFSAEQQNTCRPKKNRDSRYDAVAILSETSVVWTSPLEGLQYPYRQALNMAIQDFFVQQSVGGSYQGWRVSEDIGTGQIQARQNATLSAKNWIEELRRKKASNRSMNVKFFFTRRKPSENMPFPANVILKQPEGIHSKDTVLAVTAEQLFKSGLMINAKGFVVSIGCNTANNRLTQVTYGKVI